MKIYIAIVEDRHTDVQAYPFSTAEKAIEFAKEAALEISDTMEESVIEGWLYYARHECESDSVHVVKTKLYFKQLYFLI